MRAQVVDKCAPLYEQHAGSAQTRRLSESTDILGDRLHQVFVADAPYFKKMEVAGDPGSGPGFGAIALLRGVQERSLRLFHQV